MNFDKLYAWALAVVIAFAAAGRLDELQAWIWKAQARVLFESRTATWGSPRIFPDRHPKAELPNQIRSPPRANR